jgi:hypothetical protein
VISTKTTDLVRRDRWNRKEKVLWKKTEIVASPSAKKNSRDLSKIFIAPEPFDLRARISVNDIALIVLEIPGNDDHNIPFTNPDFLFDLSLDPSHPRCAVKTAHPDMICTHHQFGAPEHFAVSGLGQFYPDDFINRRWYRFFVCQYYLSCICFILCF